MTTIVWDGKTLAADKQASANGHKRSITKIFNINGNFVGFSGDWDYAQELKHWIENGCKIEKYPSIQSNKDDWVDVLVITPNKQVLNYNRSPYPMDFTEAGAFCMGSGREYAFGAIAMGADAVMAVKVACTLDATSGMGIDFLTM